MRNEMKTTTLLCILGGLALVAVGCEDKPATPVTNTSGTIETPPTTARATPAPSVIDPLANAENKDRVKQYPDELKLTPKAATLLTGVDTFIRDRTDALGGTTETIITVPTGVTVQEIAREKDYYLVLYPDPKNASKQMAGWVYKDALEASAWPTVNGQGQAIPATGGAPAKLTCKSTEKQLRGSHDFCARECKKDDDCKSAPGGLCDGVAYEVKKDGTASSKDASRYCVLNSENVDRAPDMPMK